MTSEIDPNNINSSFPAAEQNNSSQGFRDNFSSIKSNFEKAALEISGLQNALIGITGPIHSTAYVSITGPNAVVINTQFKESTDTYVPEIPGTGAFKIPAGTTAERPAALIGPIGYGQLRFNNETNSVECYTSSGWVSISSGAFPVGGATGTVLSKQSSLDNDLYWKSLTAAYDLCFDFAEDVIPDGAKVSVVVGRNCVIPSDFSGSVYRNSANATVAQTFNIFSNNGSGDVAIGNVSVTTGGAGTYSSATPGSPVSLTAGDRISIVAPTPADSTLSGAFFTVLSNITGL